jgi:DNA-binding CsgD family transcriptional regulator
MNNDSPGLGEREKEALRLLLAGHDAKSIAASLGLSVHTVNERLRDARRKLGVSSSREAARRLATFEGQDPNFLGDKEFGVVPSARGREGPGEPHRRRGGAIGFVWLGGGMLIMSLIIAGAVLTFALQGNGETNAAPAAQTPTAAAADVEAQSRGMAPARAHVR